MIKKQRRFVAVLVIFFTVQIFAQKEKIIGFWQIEKVVVGDKNRTPVAKWTKINNDGTYQSGNGWLQNSKGKWNYDTKTNQYSTIDSLGILDEFGGFDISFQHTKMYWKREEEGAKVEVTLVPIQELPISPADYLVGIWELIDMKKNNKNIVNNENKSQKLFIRWDRIYINFNQGKKKLTGYWHIHGHKPEITFIPHSKTQQIESWRVVVDKEQLLLLGISETNRNVERRYIRRNTF
ncbi:hypothetical protein [Tenacibaculum agarivorans]|uniref:hypothetical protein n=1 Tax=Tenacibaculum agarivorans TaxID=1908389 RepID=UPI00094B9EE4|nr:hypothetical protein [Tenacibaculum agarivorans]